MPKIFDTHAHYDDHRFDEDRNALLCSMEECGVGRILNAACDLNSSQTSLALAEQYPFIYAAVGIHPEQAETADHCFEDALERLSEHQKCVAIGEIGLDYHYEPLNREVQMHVFERQLSLAEELNLPVIIHERDALADTLRILRQYKGRVTGVFHCFSGSVETMKTVVDLGMYIGLGGVVTFTNARHAPMVAAAVPADRLLLETDCPYMAPVPMRGKRNDSGYLTFVAEKIASLRGVSPETVITETWRNGSELFRIRES